MTLCLTIDAGNSQLSNALYQDGALLATERTFTRPFLTTAQLTDSWRAFLKAQGLAPGEVHLSISSVVPDFHQTLQAAAEQLSPLSYHWVDQSSPHGFQLSDSFRREIGADLIAGLVGARERTPGTLVVVDCGTATTLTVLSAEDLVKGVAILPGIVTQVRTITGSAPHLPDEVSLTIPPVPYGTNTVEALQTGILYGHAEAVEGLIRRYRELEGDLTVFGCGGLFHRIAPLCPSVAHQEALLVNEGCRVLSLRQLQEGVLAPSNRGGP